MLKHQGTTDIMRFLFLLAPARHRVRYFGSGVARSWCGSGPVVLWSSWSHGPLAPWSSLVQWSLVLFEIVPDQQML